MEGKIEEGEKHGEGGEGSEKRKKRRRHVNILLVGGTIKIPNVNFPRC